MRRKPLLIILASFLLFSVSSGLAIADQGNSLIDKLSIQDAFHPDMSSDYYNEWHYFNVIDEEQNLSLITSFKLSGSTPDAAVLLGYHVGAMQNASYTYNPQGPDFLKGTDITVYNNKIILTEKGYQVIVNGTSLDGKQIIFFEAIFKPFTEPSPVLSVDPIDDSVPESAMNWLVASPKMKVTGTFTISDSLTGEKTTYKLKNVRGYHDHNRGYWDWANIGWDWGQVTQTKNSLNGNDLGTYTISFGNVRGPDGRGSVLNVWKNKNIVEEIWDDVEITHTFNQYLPPTYTTINASSKQSDVDIVFATESFLPIPVPSMEGTGLIIWECFGTYAVEGSINGKEVSYKAKGFMEYVPN